MKTTAAKNESPAVFFNSVVSVIGFPDSGFRGEIPILLRISTPDTPPTRLIEVRGLPARRY